MTEREARADAARENRQRTADAEERARSLLAAGLTVSEVGERLRAAGAGRSGRGVDHKRLRALAREVVR